MAEPGVAVIVPVLDEEGHIEGLIAALAAQTLPPSEVVFADGGSTDGTRRMLVEAADRDGRIRVVDGPGGIAENRNTAIEATHCPIIACVDAGCLPDSDWLERLTEPLRRGESEWVGGIALPVSKSGDAAVRGLVFVPAPDEIDATHHIPPGASQAFRKTAWVRVGGFPEGMAAAEDTVFGQRMVGVGHRPVFRPDAIVRWSAPEGPTGVLAKAFRWGRADGKAATADRAYWRLLSGYWVPVLSSLAFAFAGLGVPAVASAAVPLLLASIRVRYRWRYLDHFWQRLVLPVAYVAKTQAQTLGWATAAVANATPRTMGLFLTRPFRHLSMAVRRLIRPIVPDRVVGWLRRGSVKISPISAAVDVIVDDDGDAQQWLLATPATYRVRAGSGLPEAISDPEVVITANQTLDPNLSRLLLRPFADPEIEVSVIGEAEPPRVRRTAVGEPEVAVLATAVRQGVADLPSSDDPAVVFHMARQAGLRIALTPRPESGLPSGRRDAIGDPGSVVILGAVPLHDVGGGSRGAQLAHEFLSRGYHVVYAHMFDAGESTDLGLRYVHPNLETVPARATDSPLDDLLDRLIGRLRTENRLVLAEIPHLSYLPAVRRLRGEGFTIIYDLIDDWADPALGVWGFSPKGERALVVGADHLIASAALLVEDLERRARRPVTLVPNAVNARLFTSGEHPRPDDWPSGEGPVFEYHGSLYGDWFDWGALASVGTAFPQARIIIIGDEPPGHPVMPDNVWFLGLKPQHQLAGYLAHADVGLLPFGVSSTTHAVSPLKIYECLAMGLPVAAPALRSLRDLAGVFTDDDLAEAVSAALAGPPPDPEQVRAEHGWSERVTRILDVAGFAQVDQGNPVRISQRSIRYYTKSERRLF